MTKSIALVLSGFLIGAVTIRVFYPSSESSTPSESVQSQSRAPSDTSDEVRNDLEPGISSELDRQIGRNESRSEGSTIARNGSSENPTDATSALVENAVSVEQGLASGDVNNQQSDRSGEPQAAEAIERARPPLFPEEYYGMLEPPSRLRLRPDELISRFALEARDEGWAYTMELGINQHIAGSMNVAGTVVEYVECRATACVMAGYVQPGFEDSSGSLIGEMAGTGWWQLGPGTSSRASDNDGVARFVHIIPRTQDDFFEDVPTDPSEGFRESTTQSRELGNAKT